MRTPKKMAKLLAEKLTKEEYLEFAEMLDGDPPAGPFYCAVVDLAARMAPELYQSVSPYQA